jgi:superfamily II DNA or RNA helicase
MQKALPDFLKPFEAEAQRYLTEERIRDIEFSGATYQLQLLDLESNKPEWAFIQLDKRGNIKDCFCSCEQIEEHAYCAHIAAAFLQIYNNSLSALHQRFSHSLWNALCFLYAQRLGSQPIFMATAEKGTYRYAPAGNTLFFIKGKTPAALSFLEDIIENRPPPTEQTSIKFSNLSQEELKRWREGKPSAELQYQLSFWSDIAHWLMLQQEKHAPYNISFSYAPDTLPQEIKISFPEVELGFHLSREDLPSIIPSLDSVASPITVHHMSRKTISHISYDKKESCFVLGSKEISKKTADRGIELEGWAYVKGEGFYTTTSRDILSKKKLFGIEVEALLDSHFPLVQRVIENTSLHSEAVPLHYTLHFDSEWNLTITAYLFTSGDLTTGDSHYFGHWVYIDSQGFYPITHAHFSREKLVISADQMADFIRRERSWLNTQTGFAVHLANIETQLVYHVTADQRLSFSRLAATVDEDNASHDFGEWIYVNGQGFYPKISGYTSLPLRTDIAISADQIPLFIRTNHSELEMVPHFFSNNCPVSHVGLNVSLKKGDLIEVTPEYTLLPEYQGKGVLFFDDYSYMQGEGFYELPVAYRLPERFRYPIVIEKEQVLAFLNEELPSLQPYLKQVDPRLQPIDGLYLYAKQIKRVEESEGGQYALQLLYRSGEIAIPLSQIATAIAQKKRFLFTEGGRLDVSEVRFEWIKKLAKGRLDKRTNRLLLFTMEVIRLQAIEDLKVDPQERNVEGFHVLEELSTLHVPAAPDTTGMTTILRSYQEIGLQWLWFLYHHNLSGLLCDDMGLGKTHQTIALCAAVYNLHRNNPTGTPPPRFLVICPTSVLCHWQEKLKVAMPELRVRVFYGSERHEEEFQKDYDLLLTSYGVWRIEMDMLSKISFSIAIFDEIQVAKNYMSRVHASLLKVKARMRLGLTGTPIENHLRELKSLFDIVLPHYMPSDHEYRVQFLRPIERDNHSGRKTLLSRLIKPFVMRRCKQEVLQDLPEKTEEISHCTLSSDQQILYQEAMQRSRQRLIDQLEDEDCAVPYLHIFALLSSLKQICNHPAAYLKAPDQYTKYESGKWDLFVELLHEARDSGQKVVVFSQYLAMLDIFEAYLNAHKIGFCTIRGSTKRRGEQVERFNNDPKKEVFIGSLQAAGLGIDLTAASVVIHYDRWWNAARENQATDRVHRIGQTRGVQVFKLVTQNTFEERIDAIIQRKNILMEQIISIDDHRFLKQLDRKELIELLQYPLDKRI